jgi:hypothetical protein
MAFQLEFQSRETYRSLTTGITIEAVLQHGTLKAVCLAKVDTGSEVCLFERGVAEALEVDLKSGYRRGFSTLTGELFAYGHDVRLQTLGLQLETTVYFAESDQVKRNLLGRQGWLQLVKLGVVDYDSEIYLSRYSGL